MAKKKAKKKEMSKKDLTKKIFSIILIIIAIGGIVFLVINQGGFAFSRFQLGESLNPTGNYYIEIENRFGLDETELDFSVIICNQTHLIEELTVEDGIFSTGSNQTSVLNATQQSYAVIVSENFRPDVIAIECSDDSEGNLNVLPVVSKATEENMAFDIDISSVPDEVGEIFSYEDWNEFTDYSVNEGETYSVKISIDYAPVIFEDAWCIGEIQILPDYIIDNYLEYAITSELFLNNYVAHMFMINCHGYSFSSSTSNQLDEETFIYDTGSGNSNYSCVMLNPIYANPLDTEEEFLNWNLQANYSCEIQFTANETKNIRYCLYDGSLDIPFTSGYQYYQYGGFY